jgi:gamma-glutamyltranspeptidase/glutathione hydrolase
MLADLIERGAYLQPIDIVSAKATEMQPLVSSYRGAEVLTYPWPGGGGELAEALNILQNFSAEYLREDTVERLHVLVESFRIARIEHLQSAHDPARRAAGPTHHLSLERARRRAAAITPGRAIPEEELTTAFKGPRMGEHTTHLSVADRWGNAVAMTQTLCRQYGAKIATPGLGFPHNSCLEFFNFEDHDSPFYLWPRGRYASNMAPAIIRNNGMLMILGSAGSDRIAGSMVTVVSNLIDRKMSLGDAVVAPRVLWNSAHDPQRLVIEIADPITEEDANRLESFGFEHQFRHPTPPAPTIDSAFFGGVNAVLYDPSTGVFTGVGDPRRYGFALGPRVVAQPEANP